MPIDPLFKSMQISASGLKANRRWMDTISENIANAQTTRTETGGPYRRKITTFQEVADEVTLKKSARPHNIELNRTQREHLTADFKRTEQIAGREVETGVTEDGSDFQWVWDPSHPDANAEGYVAYPNVEVVREMVDLIAASRAYEANITAMNSAKTMNKKALDI